MDILYRTSATVTGGRTGHGRSEDGLLDVELQTAKELGPFLVERACTVAERYLGGYAHGSRAA